MFIGCIKSPFLINSISVPSILPPLFAALLHPLFSVHDMYMSQFAESILCIGELKFSDTCRNKIFFRVALLSPSPVLGYASPLPMS